MTGRSRGRGSDDRGSDDSHSALARSARRLAHKLRMPVDIDGWTPVGLDENHRLHVHRLLVRSNEAMEMGELVERVHSAGQTEKGDGRRTKMQKGRKLGAIRAGHRLD